MMRITEPTGWLGAPPWIGIGHLGLGNLGVPDTRLLARQRLNRGKSIESPNRQARLTMQADGNLVVYHGNSAIWDMWDVFQEQKPGGYAVMQADGNFVVYQADGQPAWSSATNGNPGAFLALQDDGNLVVYGRDNTALWSSHTEGFRDARTDTHSGSPIGAITSAVGSALSPVADLVVSPITTAVHIVQGDNVLSALGDHFKSVIADVKGIAPMAQTIVSFVPGVGAGVNAAIAAGAAIAQGESITDALVDAAKNALPGGPLAASAFDAAYHMTIAAATGQNVGEAALTAARNALPSDIAKRAFDTGLAIAHGRNVQQALVSGAAQVAAGAAGSIVPIPSIPIPAPLATIAKTLTPEATRIAAAIFSQPTLQSMPPADLAKTLHSDPQTVAVAIAAVGKVKRPPVLHAPPAPPPKKPPAIHAPPPVIVTAAGKPTPSVPPGGAYAPYPANMHGGALSAPPHPHGGGGGHPGGGRHFGRPVVRGAHGPRGWGHWWDVPWSPDVDVTIDVSCRTWGAPVDLPPAMERAARAALGASGWQPTTVRGPDGVLYLFSFERGAVVARPCAAVAAA